MWLDSLPTVLGGETKCTMSKINGAEHGFRVTNGCLAGKYVYAMIWHCIILKSNEIPTYGKKKWIKVPKNPSLQPQWNLSSSSIHQPHGVGSAAPCPRSWGWDPSMGLGVQCHLHQLQRSDAFFWNYDILQREGFGYHDVWVTTTWKYSVM